MNKLQKALTATAVSAALVSGLGFAQPGPQGQQGQRGQNFRGQDGQQRSFVFGQKGGPRGMAFGMQNGQFKGVAFGMQGSSPFARQGGPRGMQGGPLGKIAHLTQGSTVTVSFYDADPATGAAASSSLSLVVGVESEMTFMKSFREAAKTANYIVINTGPQSRTIELNKEKDTNNFRRGQGESKVSRMLSRLDLNSTVQASFYNANPADGGAALTTLSFVAGQDSELAFKNAFEAASENATWVTTSVSAQEHTINVAEIRTRRAEVQNKMGERGFGPGQRNNKPGQ